MTNPFALFPRPAVGDRRTLKWQAYPPDVLPLWVAEMDTTLPEPVRDAVVAAVERGEVGYPWGRSYPDALAAFAATEWGWSLDPSVLRHTTDVMTGMAAVIRVVTPPDGTVIITPPVYPPFLDLPAVTGRPVRFAPLDPDGRLDSDGLAEVLAGCRRDGSAPTVLLCNPHNPTGAAHTRPELETLAATAAEFGARVVVDEIHAPLVHPPATFVPYLTVAGSQTAYAIHSASKAFNLPGLKAALIVPGDGAVAEITAALPGSVDHSASSAGILAHTVALTEGRSWLAAHRAGLVENRDLLAALLADRLPQVVWRPPEATYLAWLDCRGLRLDGEPAAVFLDRARVAVNDGRAFGPGGGGHVRLNFATSPEILREAVDRMAAVVDG